MISTSQLVGRDDLTLREWTVIDLKSLKDLDVFDRHMFGFCDDTGVFQLSSKIIDDQETYFETRSRKYFKQGPQVMNLDLQATDQLCHFLHRGWGIPIPQLQQVLEKVTTIKINDDGYVILPTEDQNESV